MQNYLSVNSSLLADIERVLLNVGMPFHLAVLFSLLINAYLLPDNYLLLECIAKMAPLQATNRHI